MTKNEALQEVQDLSTGITHDAAQLLKLVGTGSVQLPIAGTDAYVVIGTLAGIAATAGEPFADVERLLAHAAAGEPSGWMHEDGRIVTAATMAGARKDGGAILSSLRGYTIPLYAPIPQLTAPAPQANTMQSALLMPLTEGEKNALARLADRIEEANEQPIAIARSAARVIDRALLTTRPDAAPAPQQSEGLSDERVSTADEATEWAQIFYRNADTFTFRDLGIVQAAWAEATRRATQAAIAAPVQADQDQEQDRIDRDMAIAKAVREAALHSEVEADDFACKSRLRRMDLHAIIASVPLPGAVPSLHLSEQDVRDQARDESDLDRILNAFGDEADADKLMSSGGMERLTAFDYFKRGWVKGSSLAAKEKDQMLEQAEHAVDEVMHAADDANESGEAIGAYRCLTAIQALRALSTSSKENGNG